MRYILAVLLVAALSATAWSYDLEGDDISVTEGFQVVREHDRIVLLNNTEHDAYSVYVLVYHTDEGHPVMHWDQTAPREHVIPVVPAGFKVYIDTPVKKSGFIATKYHARVYYDKEY